MTHRLAAIAIVLALSTSGAAQTPVGSATCASVCRKVGVNPLPDRWKPLNTLRLVYKLVEELQLISGSLPGIR
jgi:hypothetical protein